MVQFGGISLRYYVIPTFSLLYIIFGTLLPIWNLIFIGTQSNIHHNFPYPFSLLFIEFLFSTFIFCILNIIQRFVIPYLYDNLFKFSNNSTDKLFSQYRVNKVKIDRVTNQQVAFYGQDAIRRPGLFTPIDFNQPDNTNTTALVNSFEDDKIDFENGQPKDTGSTNASLISGISQITQFSIGGTSAINTTLSSNLTSSFVTTNVNITPQYPPKQNNKSDIGTPRTISLDLTGYKSWCFDSNFCLKLCITFKSGILFGLSSCLFMASSMFVPVNLSILIHSFVLMLITIYTKIYRIERIDFGSIVFASLAVISIVPFCIHPFQNDKLYYDNKHKVNGEEYIIISLICDCIGAIIIVLNILSISNLCLSIRPSKMRFDTDREPSIIEIAFFISLWSSIIAICPCVFLDGFFHSENILTTNISSNYNDQNIFDALQTTPYVFQNILLSVIISTGYIFSFIACLSIMTILSVAILYDFVIITHAILYFNCIEKNSKMKIHHIIGLICAYISCLMYLIVRIIENKRYLKLTWNEYFTRQNRINSNESFTTLLSNISGQKPNVFRSPGNNNVFSPVNTIFKVFSPSFNKLAEQNEKEFGKKDDHEDSIFSISTHISEEKIRESKTYTGEYTPTEPIPKHFDGPNMHNNRFGLPEYVTLPNDNITEQQQKEQDDYLFHNNLIQDNIKYYKHYEKRNAKKKRKKHKKRKKKRHKHTVKIQEMPDNNDHI
eukprot:230547_1